MKKERILTNLISKWRKFVGDGMQLQDGVVSDKVDGCALTRCFNKKWRNEKGKV